MAEALPTQQEVDTRLLHYLPDDPEGMEHFISAINICPARSSTEQYYRENKDLSYPVNLQSDTRGRAVVFVMTRDRPRWQCDVWNLNKMFKSLNIQAKNVYDPTVDRIEDELKQFVTDDANNNSSCCFIVFMGHGVSKHGYDVCIQAADGLFDVMNYCEVIFGRPSSKVKLKPKLFLAQACRNLSTTAEVQKIVSLRHCSILTDYLFVNACHPGQSADREETGSPFVKYMTESIVMQAHHKHIEDINKQVMRNFNSRRDEQMPQYVGSMPYYMNLFPGVTKTNIEPVRELFSNVSIPETGMLDEDLSRPLPATRDNEQDKVCKPSSSDTDSPTETCLIPSKSKLKITAADNENRDIKRVKYNHKSRYNLKLDIQSTNPNIQDAKQDAYIHMVTHLTKPNTITLVEDCLSSELETKVTVTNIKEGSIIIEVSLEDESFAKFLVPLSDSEMLSRKLQKLLVSTDYLNTCIANEVQIHVELSHDDIRTLKLIVEESMIPVLTGISENISMSCAVKIDGVQGRWYKDNEPIDENVRRKFRVKDGICSMDINDVVMSDAGKYYCAYSGVDGRNHIHHFSIEVLCDPFRRKLRREMEVQIEHVTTSTATIKWKSSRGELHKSHFKITSWLEQTNIVNIITVEDGPCTLTDLISGQCYKVYVTAVSTDGIESWPSPLNGLQFYTNVNLKLSYDADARQIIADLDDCPFPWWKNLELIGCKQDLGQMHKVMPDKISHGVSHCLIFKKKDLHPEYSYVAELIGEGPKVDSDVIGILQAPDKLTFVENEESWEESYIQCNWKGSDTVLLQTGYKIHCKKQNKIIQESIFTTKSMTPDRDMIPIKDLLDGCLPTEEYQFHVAVMTEEGSEVWFDPVTYTTPPDNPIIESTKIEESDGNYIITAKYKCEKGNVDGFVVQTLSSPRPVLTGNSDKIFTKDETKDTEINITIPKHQIKEQWSDINYSVPLFILLKVSALYKGKSTSSIEHVEGAIFEKPDTTRRYYDSSYIID